MSSRSNAQPVAVRIGSVLRKMIADWRLHLALGVVSIVVAIGGGMFTIFPAWLTAIQGMVGGVFLTFVVIELTAKNGEYMMEALPDERV